MPQLDAINSQQQTQIEQVMPFKEYSGKKVALVVLLITLCGAFGIYRYINKKFWPYRDGFYPVTPGLEYSEMDLGAQSRAHVFRIDLHYWRPVAKEAKNDIRTKATVKELATEANLPFLVNGTFFDEKDRPLGLLISEGTQKNPLRKGADWGVLLVRDETPVLLHTKELNAIENIDFAVQCGPRIVIDGKVPKLKPQAAPRTALGITRDGKLIVAVTYGSLVFADALGTFLLENLEVTDALLLDGGPSTQLYAKIGKLSLDLPGGTTVTNGIGLTKRN